MRDNLRKLKHEKLSMSARGKNATKRERSAETGPDRGADQDRGVAKVNLNQQRSNSVLPARKTAKSAGAATSAHTCANNSATASAAQDLFPIPPKPRQAYQLDHSPSPVRLREAVHARCPTHRNTLPARAEQTASSLPTRLPPRPNHPSPQRPMPLSPPPASRPPKRRAAYCLNRRPKPAGGRARACWSGRWSAKGKDSASGRRRRRRARGERGMGSRALGRRARGGMPISMGTWVGIVRIGEGRGLGLGVGGRSLGRDRSGEMSAALWQVWWKWRGKLEDIVVVLENGAVGRASCHGLGSLEGLCNAKLDVLM